MKLTYVIAIYPCGIIFTCMTIYIEYKRPRTVRALAIELAIPNFTILLQCFLFECLNPDDPCDIMTIPDFELPCYDGPVSVFHSASSQFYAPSDLCRTGRMHEEHIQSCPMWRGGGPRYDCVFVGSDPDADGMHGYEIARVLCFFPSSIRASLILVQPYTGLIKLVRNLMSLLECGSFARALFPIIHPTTQSFTSTQFIVRHI